MEAGKIPIKKFEENKTPMVSSFCPTRNIRHFNGFGSISSLLPFAASTTGLPPPISMSTVKSPQKVEANQKDEVRGTEVMKKVILFFSLKVYNGFLPLRDCENKKETKKPQSRFQATNPHQLPKIFSRKPQLSYSLSIDTLKNFYQWLSRSLSGTSSNSIRRLMA